MAITEWDRNSEGNVWLNPLRESDVVHLHEIGVGLGLDMLSGPGEPRTPIRAQVAMTVEQAVQLIDRLQLMVDYIRTRKPTSEPN